jgi:uncharacterized membrane protein YesL
VAGALGYAVEALRLLRRHPSLVLVALAMGAFNGVEGPLGDFAAVGHTAWGRQYIQVMQGLREVQVRRPHRSPRPRPFNVRAQRMAGLAILVCPPTGPWLSLWGTTTAVAALAYGPTKKFPRSQPADWRDPTKVGRLVVPMILLMLVPALAALVSLPIGIFVAGGFMGMARGMVATGNVPWREFAAQARRVFFRFVVFGAAVALLGGVLAFGHVLIQQGYAGGILLALPLAPILFSLSLTTFVIVAEDASLVAAVKRSVVAIWRNVATALTLVMGAGALVWLSYQPVVTFHARMQPRGGAWNPAAAALPSLASSLLYNCLLAGVATWFCVAMFLWWQEAGESRKPRREDMHC